MVLVVLMMSLVMSARGHVTNTKSEFLFVAEGKFSEFIILNLKNCHLMLTFSDSFLLIVI